MLVATNWAINCCGDMGTRFVTRLGQGREMGILCEQVVGARCDSAIGEDAVVGVCGDDAKLE